MKEVITITSSLDKLAVWYDYTIVCDDIKVVQRQLELTNPIEYTREELLKKYDGKTRISKWEHTYTEDGQPAMAVVIEND